MNQHFFYYLGLSLFIMHEMDAIRCREWRMFPGLSLLNDKVGHLIFMLAHIPIFYFLLKSLTVGPNQETPIEEMSIFMIVHLVLHILFLKHKKNEFTDWISWTIIIGTALCGLLELITLKV